LKYLEWSEENFIGLRLILGHLASGNIADQPPDALSGFKLANDGERRLDAQALGSIDFPLASGGLRQKKAKTDGLDDADSGEEAKGGGGGEEGGGANGGSRGSGGGQEKLPDAISGGGEGASQKKCLEHVELL
jgi:hypothetical protein